MKMWIGSPRRINGVAEAREPGPIPHNTMTHLIARAWAASICNGLLNAIGLGRDQLRGYAGFLEAAVVLEELLVRRDAEHSRATSRARADLLLPALVPSELAPCGIFGWGRSQIVEARVLMRKLRCVLRLRQSRAQIVPGMA